MRRFLLPILSGVALALSLYPFYFWPLAFVALFPLYRFSTLQSRRGDVFWGGFIAGAVGTFPTVYFSLAQLILFPDAPLFTYMIRLSSIPAVLLSGSLFGLAMLLYKTLRSDAPVRNSLLGAACYGVVEIILFKVFGGYYYASLAHAVVNFSPVMWYAAFGGALFVSVGVAWLNALSAEIAALRERTVPAAASILLSLAVFVGIGAWQFFSTRTPLPENKVINVTIIQMTSEELLPSFLEEKDGTLSNTYLENRFRTAALHSDLVIYPFSPVKGVVYQGEKPVMEGVSFVAEDAQVGAWAGALLPTTTAVVLWNTIADSGKLFDEYAVWQGGVKSEYRKRALYALSDTAPAWLTSLGLSKTSITIEPGAPENQAVFGDVRVGG
ncbi:MAG: hypothetical protein G01um101456_372, partial [Parcubacteria group bacterium Gr01-1014_56]